MPKFDFKSFLVHFLELYGQVPADGMFEIPMMGAAYALPSLQDEDEGAPDSGEVT
jgi:hypothetical protein